MPITEDILQEGEEVRERWVVSGKLGGGGFGQVYKAEDREQMKDVAIKVEPTKDAKQVLRIEVFLLRKYQNYKHAPKLYGCGQTANYNFMVLSLCSRNLSELRRDSPTQRFSRGTSFRLFRQGLTSLKDLHSIGFLHRDVKPSNFAIGLQAECFNVVFLLDYGLARLHMDEAEEVRPPRENAGFRGTVRYAPIVAHDRQEMGRKDDLWSLIYMLVEMARGILPWRRVRDKNQVGHWKKRTTLPQLFEDLPPRTEELGKHLQTLSYFDKPRYEKLEQVAKRICEEVGVKEGDKYDWEEDYTTAMKEEKTRLAGQKKQRPHQTRTAVQDTKAEADGPPSQANENMSFEQP